MAPRPPPPPPMPPLPCPPSSLAERTQIRPVRAGRAGQRQLWGPLHYYRHHHLPPCHLHRQGFPLEPLLAVRVGGRRRQRLHFHFHFRQLPQPAPVRTMPKVSLYHLRPLVTAPVGRPSQPDQRSAVVEESFLLLRRPRLVRIPMEQEQEQEWERGRRQVEPPMPDH